MRLLDLNPRWVGHGGKGISDKDGNSVPYQRGVGLSCDCPCGGCGYRLYVGFENPLEGEPPKSESPRWRRTGSDFQTLTLHPSIRRIGACGWHGWIKQGAIKHAGDWKPKL